MSKVLELLRQTDYAELFERLSPHVQKAILALPGALAELRQAVIVAGTPPDLRFLASELLYCARAPGWPGPEAAAVIPEIYARALAAAEDAGPWGLPGMWTHPATDHLIQMGMPAIHALKPLLADEKRLRYTGSKRATLGELYRMRVKDIAAFIIASILGIPYPLEESQERRDAFIRDLAERVGG